MANQRKLINNEDAAIVTDSVSVSTINDFNSLAKPRVLTANITLGETETFEGNRFYAEYDESYAAGETKYVIYQMPNVASGKVVALQSRAFKTFESEASIEILWDSTGVVAGTTVPSFNENRNSLSTATMTINEVTSLTAEGTIRERDFIPATTGPGSTSAGGIASSLGFRLYSPDSFFILKVTNGATAQRIHVAYTWFELSSSDLS